MTSSPVDIADLRRRAVRWITDDPDPATQDELRAILRQPELETSDLADRFSGSLQFGTAGLRGVLGAGPNRMNRAVVARTTWGLAQEILHAVTGAEQRGVVVGADARRMSREFSEDVAAILGDAGIRVILFQTPVPTPLVAFTVKHLGAAAGVVITASHNPAEYNGYKVYWESGAQIVSPREERIAASIDRAPPARAVRRPDLRSLASRGLVVVAPEETCTAYIAAIRALSVHPREGDRALRIVYTPLHGVGDTLMRRVLREAGFTAVAVVPEQQEPDSAFPTVAFPNPEERGAMDLALSLAKTNHADLVLANDPDADRLAVAVPEPAPGGRYRQLTGNQVGVLLGHYLLAEGALAEKPYRGQRAVLASIVSSPCLGRIAVDLGARYEETLTGFKWIAHRAVELEREGYDFVFGYEEALGYCVGTAVRDKDGISAGLLMAELSAVLGARGLTLLDALNQIAHRWGAYASAQVSMTRKGASGLDEILAVMDRLRARPPEDIAGDAVVAITDYDTRLRTERSVSPVATRPFSPRGPPLSTPLALPRSNVLALEFASGARIVARPSGTEPKAKFYFDVREDVRRDESAERASARALARTDFMVAAFRDIVGV